MGSLPQHITGEMSYKFFNTVFDIWLSTEEFQILHLPWAKQRHSCNNLITLRIYAFFPCRQMCTHVNSEVIFLRKSYLIANCIYDISGFCKVLVNCQLNIIIARDFLTSRLILLSAVLQNGKRSFNIICFAELLFITIKNYNRYYFNSQEHVRILCKGQSCVAFNS